MFNDALKYTLEIILEHVNTCQIRFSEIKSPNDFVTSDEGILILDSIAIRLQAIGENVKNISKNNSSFFEKHDFIDWDKIIRFRDFISHHYEMLDYEIVYQICDYYLPKLRTVIEFEIKKFEN